MTDSPRTGLQLRSLIQASGTLELSLADVPVPTPDADEVLVRVEAAPINPSDLALLIGPARVAEATFGGTPERPVVVLPIPEAARPSVAARVGTPTPVGNEGAGIVIAAGASPAAQALRGQRVAMIGGAMYAQYRLMKVAGCLPLPADVTSAEGASSFVNPMTALGMVETMKREGHRALAHTAAASNLGQMLNRLCITDGIDLVNIVRRPEQAELLRGSGAAHVCDSSVETFGADLIEHLGATGATVAFDATAGGPLAGQILGAMEAAAIVRGGASRSVYGTSVHKQVYLYGILDPRPTSFQMTFGFAWSISGWLLGQFLNRIGPDAAQGLRLRVRSELKTTFASHYTRTVSLAGALRPDAIAVYARRATGEKFLIDPTLDAPGS